MTSSVMPVFSARVALCSTWFDCWLKRSLKKSSRVGFAGIGANRFMFPPFAPLVNNEPTPRR